MKLYIAVAQNGFWNAQAFSGRKLFEGWIAPDGSMGHDSEHPLPDAVESAVRQAWVSKRVVSVRYTPENTRGASA